MTDTKTQEIIKQANKHTSFAEQIKAMHSMYNLPISSTASLHNLKGQYWQERIKGFLNTIRDEITEGDELLEVSGNMSEEEILVALGDWFADIIVYARSEAMKFGLDTESHLKVIMASNFTKLGEDGLPIYNADGKFMKGPNFQAPEKYIGMINDGTMVV